MKKRILILVASLAALAAVGAVATSGQAAAAVAPAVTTEPQITGTLVVGASLTASTGVWSNTPTGYAYQWVRCPVSGGASDGSDCTVVASATTNTYALTAADVGFRLRVKVTATNADGSATSASNATETVPATTGITNTAIPTLSGSASVGSVLTATGGTFTGDNLVYAYSWARCPGDGTCVAIANATALTYTVQQADVGATLRFTVVATSGASKLAVSGAPTATVTAGTTPTPTPPTPTPPATGCPTGTGVIPIASLAVPAQLSIQKFVVTPRPVTPSAASISAQITVTACGGRPVQGALVFATAVPYQQFAGSEQPTNEAGIATLQMQKLRRFPASSAQQLLAMFIRARQPSGDPLGGVSARRLVSFRVNLNG